MSVGNMRADDEFTSFVRASGGQLERMAFLLTADRHLAEDLVQTTFLKVYRSWERVRHSPVAYARRTLLNSLSSHHRVRRSAEVPTDLAGHDGRAAPGPDVTERVDTLNALASLKPRDRAVVVLRYWEDRSVASTADELGISESAVRTCARRALARLRPLLELDERPTT